MIRYELDIVPLADTSVTSVRPPKIPRAPVYPNEPVPVYPTEPVPVYPTEPVLVYPTEPVSVYLPNRYRYTLYRTDIGIPYRIGTGIPHRIHPFRKSLTFTAAKNISQISMQGPLLSGVKKLEMCAVRPKSPIVIIFSSYICLPSAHTRPFYDGSRNQPARVTSESNKSCPTLHEVPYQTFVSLEKFLCI